MVEKEEEKGWEVGPCHSKVHTDSALGAQGPISQRGGHERGHLGVQQARGGLPAQGPHGPRRFQKSDTIQVPGTHPDPA